MDEAFVVLVAMRGEQRRCYAFPFATRLAAEQAEGFLRAAYAAANTASEMVRVILIDDHESALEEVEEDR